MIKKIGLFIVVLTVGLIGLAQYPHLLINKRFEYKSFVIYSNENIEPSESMKSVLDSVLNNINTSRFKKDDNRYELYFTDGSTYEKIIRLFGMKNIASSRFEKHIYNATPDFDQGILEKNNNEYERLKLVQIISHGWIHTQMYYDYSRLGIMQTPSWVNEGYCEYISYIPVRDREDYKLSNLVTNLENNHDAWLRTEHNTMTPRQYVKDRVIIEYLINVKGLDILEIISNEALDPNEIYAEIKKYYEENNGDQ